MKLAPRCLTLALLALLGALPAAARVPSVAAGEPTAAMVAWAERLVPDDQPPAVRLRHLLDALIARGMREIEGPTETAAVAFERRRANCVALAHLMAGLGRRLGLPVFFVLLEGPPVSDERGDLRILSGHLAAATEVADGILVLDFAGATPLPAERLRRIPERRAAAIYHSNLGAEAMVDGAGSEAVVHLGAAIALDPDFEQAWLNLGVALRRVGNLPAAEGAYRRVLELDPDSQAAKRNLEVVRRLRAYEEIIP
ncbi:MAG: tetratricopeptide repeat protein [Acidobacteriota bacterium]